MTAGGGNLRVAWIMAWKRSQNETVTAINCSKKAVQCKRKSTKLQKHRTMCLALVGTLKNTKSFSNISSKNFKFKIENSLKISVITLLFCNINFSKDFLFLKKSNRFRRFVFTQKFQSILDPNFKPQPATALLLPPLSRTERRAHRSQLFWELQVT